MKVIGPSGAAEAAEPAVVTTGGELVEGATDDEGPTL
jgi:hypothetical protein